MRARYVVRIDGLPAHFNSNILQKRIGSELKAILSRMYQCEVIVSLDPNIYESSMERDQRIRAQEFRMGMLVSVKMPNGDDLATEITELPEIFENGEWFVGVKDLAELVSITRVRRVL